MNIMRFSSCTAANQVRFWRPTSRISKSGRSGCRQFLRHAARLVSRSFRRMPVGPSRRKMRWRHRRGAAAPGWSRIRSGPNQRCPPPSSASRCAAPRRRRDLAEWAISVTTSPGACAQHARQLTAQHPELARAPVARQRIALAARPGRRSPRLRAGSIRSTRAPSYPSPRASACRRRTPRPPPGCGVPPAAVVRVGHGAPAGHKHLDVRDDAEACGRAIL